jgi:anaphase-promoting complex subunit 1
MDRTSFADPDRLTVLMGEPEGLKRELTLQIIESFPFHSDNTTPDVFVVNASHKLDILCLHEHRSQVLHIYHISRRIAGAPVFKEKSRIPALSAAPITIHKSQRLLVLSSDLILRIHAPWYTRLNIVIPSTRSWRSISRINGNRFTLTDTKSGTQRFHLDLIPQQRLVAWCLDVLECTLDSSLYSLFLSVYGIARLKSNATDLSAFVVTLFACFSALNTRSSSPSPRLASDVQEDIDPWKFVLEQESRLTQSSFHPMFLLPQSTELVHHFEGVQRSNHLTVILLALHALSEELRVHIGMADHNKTLVPILCQLAYWLGRAPFVEYYIVSDIDFDRIEFDKHAFSGVRDVTFPQQEPWSIYKWLISCVHAAVPRVPQDDLLTLDVLLFKASPEKSPSTEKVNQARLLLPSIDKLRNIYPLLNLRDFRSSVINAMDENSVSPIWLDSLPIGIAYPLKAALSLCKRQPLSTWSQSVYGLIDRKDLVELLRMYMSGSELPSISKHVQKEIEDVGTVTEICQKVQSPETTASEPTLADDHETITNLIFRSDRRMLEVAKLLEYSQPGVTFWPRPSSIIMYLSHHSRLTQ